MVNGEVPTIAGARRLLEFEQAVLAEDEWWDCLLESVGGESRITLLTRESRLPQTMLLALVRNTDQTNRMRAIGLRYLSGETLQRNMAGQLLRVKDADQPSLHSLRA